MTPTIEKIEEAATRYPRYSSSLRKISILNTPIAALDMDRIIEVFEEWLTDRHDRSVFLRDVHGVMLARDDAKLREAHDEADIVAPDGMPLVWFARLLGVKDISRVCGIDLLPATCRRGVSCGWRHYFYGGAPHVAEKLVEKFRATFPGIIVVGIQSPPFRKLTSEEEENVVAGIRAAQPDFVWVGLGTPKQELWIAEHRGKCGGAIMLGIGAAFDIHAGDISRAPIWMQENGLEWFYRLMKEPRRLWRRYLKFAPKFLLLAILELVRKRKF